MLKHTPRTHTPYPYTPSAPIIVVLVGVILASLPTLLEARETLLSSAERQRCERAGNAILTAQVGELEAFTLDFHQAQSSETPALKKHHGYAKALGTLGEYGFSFQCTIFKASDRTEFLVNNMVFASRAQRQ